MYVEMRHVYKSFGGFCASDNVSFGIAQGRLAALLGPSGSGKTTILRMLAGLDTPDSGDVLIDGVRVNDVPASQRGVGFVFQNYALFRYLTVYDNIAFGLDVQKRPRTEIKARVEELLSLINLSGLEKRYPNQLSGGQKQRVAFARALAPNPHLLLLDEPFAAIDAKVRRELRSWLKEMITRVGVTSIFVTHDQEEAIEVADQVIVTNRGCVEQSGTPEIIYRAPATPFVAQFLGQSQQLTDCRVLAGFPASEQMQPGLIRPENITLYKLTEKDLPARHDVARVEQVHFRGGWMEILVSLEGSGLTLTTNRNADLSPVVPGEQVAVVVKEVCLFEGDRTRLLRLG